MISYIQTEVEGDEPADQSVEEETDKTEDVVTGSADQEELSSAVESITTSLEGIPHENVFCNPCV